jgi:hypothetical protein
METMTVKMEKQHNWFDRLNDALVDDILNASDEDILAEFTEEGGDPERNAEEMRALFEKSVLTTNKGRMVAAKAGAAADRKAARQASAGAIDIADARARLRAIINHPDVPSDLTLAARKEDELSDVDILGMLEDLAELGIMPPEADDDGKA